MRIDPYERVPPHEDDDAFYYLCPNCSRLIEEDDARVKHSRQTMSEPAETTYGCKHCLPRLRGQDEAARDDYDNRRVDEYRDRQFFGD